MDIPRDLRFGFGRQWLAKADIRGEDAYPRDVAIAMLMLVLATMQTRGMMIDVIVRVPLDDVVRLTGATKRSAIESAIPRVVDVEIQGNRVFRARRLHIENGCLVGDVSGTVGAIVYRDPVVDVDMRGILRPTSIYSVPLALRMIAAARQPDRTYEILAEKKDFDTALGWRIVRFVPGSVERSFPAIVKDLRSMGFDASLSWLRDGRLVHGLRVRFSVLKPASDIPAEIQATQPLPAPRAEAETVPSVNRTPEPIVPVAPIEATPKRKDYSKSNRELDKNHYPLRISEAMWASVDHSRKLMTFNTALVPRYYDQNPFALKPEEAGPFYERNMRVKAPEWFGVKHYLRVDHNRPLEAYGREGWPQYEDDEVFDDAEDDDGMELVDVP